MRHLVSVESAHTTVGTRTTGDPSTVTTEMRERSLGSGNSARIPSSVGFTRVSSGKTLGSPSNVPVVKRERWPYEYVGEVVGCDVEHAVAERDGGSGDNGGDTSGTHRCCLLGRSCCRRYNN